MTNEMVGQYSKHTGDINLAAAIMACQVPLDPDNPVRLIESAPDQKCYASFHLMERSEDGTTETEKLMEHWSGFVTDDPLPLDHGFRHICDFIRSRAKGVRMNTSDWIDYAVEYCAERGVKLPGLTNLQSVPAFVNALPFAMQSYILAFVFNRDYCLQLYRNARRAKFMASDDGIRHSMIDRALPQWKTKELLSRLQG